MKAHYKPGSYDCEVTAQGLSESTSGTPQFFLRFMVNDEYERTYWRALTEKTMEYAVEDLKTLGFTGSSFADLDGDCFIGQKIKMRCKHEDFNGEAQERRGLPFGGSAPNVKPVAPAKVAALDKAFGDQLAAAASAVPPARRNEPPPHSDADAPPARRGREPGDDDVF